MFDENSCSSDRTIAIIKNSATQRRQLLALLQQKEINTKFDQELMKSEVL